MAKTLEQIQNGLYSPFLPIRQKAVNELAERGAPAAYVLVFALRDENPDIRITALKALGEIQDQKTIQPMLALMGTPKRKCGKPLPMR